MTNSTCTISDCDGTVHARGWCNKHYQRWNRHGDPQPPDLSPNMREHTTTERFWAKVDNSGECWVWVGALDGKGYGMFRFRGSTWRAHRVAWVLDGRDLVPDMTLDHLCRTRSCVRADHLEQVTSRINTLRGETIAAENAAKTHCPQGHPYDDENTYVDSNGWRHCQACA